MKYSLFTTANKSYYPFLDILTSSALENCENLENIYVGDSGLGEFLTPISKKRGVISFKPNHKDEVDDEFAGVHSKGWVAATQLKTRMLRRLLKLIDFKHPLILIDSDVCILKDLSKFIDPNFDMQFTSMHTGGHTRSDGIFIRDIASFLIFNNQSSARIFVDRWIRKMEAFAARATPFPHETPAMNMTIADSALHMNLGFLKEIEVCADSELTDDTYSVHFKSNGSNDDDPITNFEKRVMSVNNITSTDIDFGKYLDEKTYYDWKLSYD
tara:strand:+ start:74 stop:883 length:810 start_codon:yes stop_codon:yes gene_type:complete